MSLSEEGISSAEGLSLVVDLFMRKERMQAKMPGLSASAT